MGFFDDPSYDIDLEKHPEMPNDLLVSEIGHSLRFKGHCVVKLGMDEDLLEQAGDEAVDLKRAGKLQPPPPQLIDALLGPEGTNEYCRLDQLPEEGDEDVEVGPELRKINQRLLHLAGASITWCASEGYDNCSKTGDYLVRGGDYSDEVAELTEESCSEWISLLNRARLMLVYIFGEGRGTLELLPFDEDSDAVELSTEPDMLVILRADQLHHKHQSNRGTYSVVTWITAAENSTTRGWTGGLSRTFGANIPTARELVEWTQDRLKELLEMETLDKDAEIPRDWQLMMRHSFFRNNRSPVAVRGEAGHLPTTNNSRVMWEAINQGSDFVTDIPYHRWDHELYYDSDPNCWLQANCFRPGGMTRTNIKHGQFIEGVDLFDNKFFGVSNMEATGMDPMQRHILETSYEALFMAGYNKKLLMGKYIAVFTGCTNPEWNYIDKEAGACSGTGSSQAITSNRTSFLLGIMGPSTSIDCDSSSAGMALMLGATAVTPATERRTSSGGDSEAAICGGVFLQMTPFMWPRFGAYMNPNGRCFSFDQSANGYVRGECCASAALKPYAEKTSAGDLFVIDGPCIGTLVGWRMTNNGRSAGLHAPSGPAEQEAIAEAIRHAGITPLDVDAMECHAAGHLLSDGVEVVSTTTVCRGMEGGDREVLMLGCVKTNVGVQQEACGISSFLKVLYNISYANNAPTIHVKQLNPHIETGDSAVCFNTEAIAYRDSRAFHGFGTRGLGGTNINMMCWYSADGTRVPLFKPKMERASFAYWPGGGGLLESEYKASEGYFIVGSWSNWREPEEMMKQKDGSYTAEVTLGESQKEAFQILLDGEADKVLHPERPEALSGTRLRGPTMRYLLHGQQLNWVIDGRQVQVAVDDAVKALVPSNTTQLQLKSSHKSLAHVRDHGNVGDTYKVKLCISGRYRAVTWSKI